MRTVLLAIGIISSAPQIGWADEAVAIVDRAVQVTANSDLRLNRLQNFIRTEQGTFSMPTGDTPARRTAYVGPPDRIKFEAVLTVGGQPQSVIVAVNGIAGWKQLSGVVENMSPAECDAAKDEADAWALITILALRQKGVTLKPLPAVTENGKPAVGVNVTRPNRPDAQIYFAADTGLPVRLTVKAREGGLEFVREYRLADYREFDGIKLPTRITVVRNGRKIEDWTVQSYRYPDRLEDKVFQKPK
jgi:hypothetical protein